MLKALRGLFAPGPADAWPRLAERLKLAFEAKPPMLRGDRNGRAVTVRVGKEASEVIVAAMLRKPTRARLEIGPKDLVTSRAGSMIPDSVAVEDAAFSARFLARCSDKAAGPKLLGAALRRRLLARPDVDIVGEGATVIWKLSAAKDAETLETALDVVSALAEELEAYPA